MPLQGAALHIQGRSLMTYHDPEAVDHDDDEKLEAERDEYADHRRRDDLSREMDG